MNRAMSERDGDSDGDPNEHRTTSAQDPDVDEHQAMPVQGPPVSPPAVEGIDILADQQTKEVLDKIGARATDPTLRIVVTGKTGVGKSSFIQALFLEELQGTKI